MRETWVESGEDGVTGKHRLNIVMPGLAPGIHVFGSAEKNVDGRVKPGHDRSRGLPYTGSPCFCANSFNEVCGRAPMCWITSAAAKPPSIPAFS
jgi:hypothetical protein